MFESSQYNFKVKTIFSHLYFEKIFIFNFFQKIELQIKYMIGIQGTYIKTKFYCPKYFNRISFL